MTLAPPEEQQALKEKALAAAEAHHYPLSGAYFLFKQDEIRRTAALNETEPSCL